MSASILLVGTEIADFARIRPDMSSLLLRHPMRCQILPCSFLYASTSSGIGLAAQVHKVVGNAALVFRVMIFIAI